MIFCDEIANFKCHKDALEEKNNDPYKDSAFKVYKDMSSKKKGKYFELIVEEYFKKNGYEVKKASSSDHDRIINGKKVEIKGSLLWGEGTHFRWQQIRTNQDYDVVCFVAIYPDRIEFHGATKDVVKSNVEVQNSKGEWIYNQHGGKKVNSGTFCIDGMPADYKWFQTLEEIL
jgi:hypothetical protein